MTKVKYLISGLSGLSVAARLKQFNETSFLYLKEDDLSGLYRSREVDGSPFSFTGKYVFDMRRKKVSEKAA